MHTHMHHLSLPVQSSSQRPSMWRNDTWSVSAAIYSLEPNRPRPQSILVAVDDKIRSKAEIKKSTTHPFGNYSCLFSRCSASCEILPLLSPLLTIVGLFTSPLRPAADLSLAHVLHLGSQCLGKNTTLSPLPRRGSARQNPIHRLIKKNNSCSLKPRSGALVRWEDRCVSL
ncbi:hypothetical protein ILYODFUR_027595 [Ilyodon furcidens]|uniref:Uncharacterized protein n=1 Tax=Ilyodon furcidens TaxID=33524 RepID=A0ABV0TN99_9TELE